MAERRMFTKKVTDDDNFMSLSSSAQALYLHLSMSADDDGFCNQVSLSMFKAHASVQDLEALLEKRYIYQFENGVIVIKHWRMANALRKDRYTPTAFQEELAKLDLKKNGSYTLSNMPKMPAEDDGCQNGNQCLPQVSVGDNRLGNVRLGDDEAPAPPTKAEVEAYVAERGNKIDAGWFFDYYNTKGWMIDGKPVTDWKTRVASWEKHETKYQHQHTKSFDSDAFRQKAQEPIVYKKGGQ